MTVSEARAARRTGSHFRAVAWIVLFAFTLQSFITQTHVHRVFGGGAAAAIIKTLTGEPSHSKLPARGDTNDCPFCQAIIYAGAFAAPFAPAIILPVSVAEIAAPIFPASAIDFISTHPWQSRAPPPQH